MVGAALSRECSAYEVLLQKFQGGKAMKKLYRTVFAMFLLIASPCIMIQAEESATLPVEGVQPVIAIRDGVIATTVENRLAAGGRKSVSRYGGNALLFYHR